MHSTLSKKPQPWVLSNFTNDLIKAKLDISFRVYQWNWTCLLFNLNWLLQMKCGLNVAKQLLTQKLLLSHLPRSNAYFLSIFWMSRYFAKNRNCSAKTLEVIPLNYFVFGVSVFKQCLALSIQSKDFFYSLLYNSKFKRPDQGMNI